MKVEATIIGADIPADAQVGDELHLSGIARITAIEDELVDITPIGGDFAYAPGDRTVKLLISKVEVREAVRPPSIESQPR